MTGSGFQRGIAERLEQVREVRGFKSLRAFHDALKEGGFGEFSYTAARNYHDPDPASGRTPPIDYVYAVALVFGIRLRWLVDGVGPVEERADTEEQSAIPRDLRRLEHMPNMPLAIVAAFEQHLRNLDTARWRNEGAAPPEDDWSPEKAWAHICAPLGGRAPLDWDAMTNYCEAAIHALNLALNIPTTEEEADG